MVSTSPPAQYAACNELSLCLACSARPQCPCFCTLPPNIRAFPGINELMPRLLLQAALDAPLPAGCTRTVYLCDDGKNKQKRKWCLGRAPEVVYVSGRQRPKGEMNGKSANLNNCLRQIYPDNVPVPANEVVCIFDADQVCYSCASSLSCVKDTLGSLQQEIYMR